MNLTGVANAQKITIGLNCVDNGLGASGDVAVTMGVLLGDVTGNGFVDSGDTIVVRGPQGKSQLRPLPRRT